MPWDCGVPQKEQVQRGTVPCWSYTKVWVGTMVLNCQTTQKKPECVSVKCSNLLKCRFALLKMYPVGFRLVSFWVTLLIWRNLDKAQLPYFGEEIPLAGSFLGSSWLWYFAVSSFLCCLLESEWTQRSDLESGLDGSWCFPTLLCSVSTSGFIPSREIGFHIPDFQRCLITTPPAKRTYPFPIISRRNPKTSITCKY